MINNDANSVRRERLLYVAVWSLIAVLPVVLELWKLINGSVFEWRFVLRWWTGMVPLIIIFLLHNHIFLPKFLKKGRLKSYAVAVLLVLTVYGGPSIILIRRFVKSFGQEESLAKSRLHRSLCLNSARLLLCVLSRSLSCSS